MIITVEQRERETQNRVVQLFRQTLKYDYLGNWERRAKNSNIEPQYLTAYLKSQGIEDTMIGRALLELQKAAGDTSKSLYDRNRAVYSLLRYGVKVSPDIGENKQTIELINWKEPHKNHFAIAEEVAVAAFDARAAGKRPDIVLYVNGIALGVLELKRSIVSVSEGIRQNLDNQKKEFIQPFYSTMQFVMAGSDTEGLRYATIETPEKYYLTWKEEDAASDIENPLDRALVQHCEKTRFLELIHDFLIFDSGTKKLCRHNQYFGVKEAQKYIRRREGGIIWHTQGSGKSLTMVWLAKWIHSNVKDARVLIITDRRELDGQIEKVFLGVDESIHRTKSGADLIGSLNAVNPWLICSLVHKFGGKEGEEDRTDVQGYLAELESALPSDFRAKGDLYVFVDECHRTQSGDLNKAMRALLPDAVFIGFTGTPLLKDDKQTSIEVFGGYIHTYKFNEAVEDKVVLDLRYEARNIEQNLTSPKKIDDWFNLKTRGLTDLAKAQLKQRWGTMRKVLSSQDRLAKIVDDILMDMELRDRLKSGRGNAMLVSGSIFQACKFYELFYQTDLRGKCAIITSYKPSAASIKGEETGEGLTEKLRQYDIYRKMLADWFGESEEAAMGKVEKFEEEVKQKFIKEPGQMKLLIVVDKLLTGFDAPPATFLYIDKQMRDHGLFQAICRVNRLDSEDKEYGYIIDYQDLFNSLNDAVKDYTSGAFDAYDPKDVAGLLGNRLVKSRERLEEVLETVRGLCEPVEPPKDLESYRRYFVSQQEGNALQLKANEPKRLALYKHVAALIRAYAAIADELPDAGYGDMAIEELRAEVKHYEYVRGVIKIASGDAIDLKLYEPAMRHLIDKYIRAEESELVTSFEDMSLVQLIVQRGVDAVNELPKSIREDAGAVAETIENNVRRLIIDETPVNPKYYEQMSDLLDALIEQRKQGTIEYREYLQQITDLTKQVTNPATSHSYPRTLNTPAKRSLYDNLKQDESLALTVDTAIRGARQDGWRESVIKIRMMRAAIKTALGGNADLTGEILELAKHQDEY